VPTQSPLKVRVGFGLGTSTSLHDERFGHVVDELERLKFDSLWVSERIRTTAPDPLVAMAFAAGRTTALKFGMSVMVLPGRNPVVLAKALASLATLSGGRLLPAFGLGAVDPHEQQAFGVERSQRAAWFDESLDVMRKCWTGEPFDHDGERYHFEGVRVLPAPRRIDVWLGGIAPSELRRVGRLADGWLPSFVTPADVASGRATIESVASEHGRSIDDDHYGVLIPYQVGTDSSGFVERITARRPDIDPADVVATSWEQLRDLIGRFVGVGASKFVVIPAGEPHTTDQWTEHLEAVSTEILPLET
jgi:probable F420-dependent oxidoreductase